jgi:photosystem II stability/assembly factor-like uncharacterized protein
LSASQALASTSADGGATWTPPVVAGRASLQDISCLDEHFCVGTEATSGTNTWGEGRLTVTDDGGKTWSTPSSGSGNAVSCTRDFCLAVGASYSQASNGYPATASISTDGGHHWTPLSPGSLGFSSVACNSLNDCVVVGSIDTPVIMTYSH